MKTSENFLTNILNNKRLSRILALILLAISVFLQIISQKYLHGDWVFLTFLASEWFMLFAILIPVHLRMKGGLPAISLTKEKPFIFYGIGSGIGILIFVLFMLVAVISKVYAFNGLANPISWGMIILFAIAFIGQSAFEEVIFRGILMHFIAKRRSKLLGIIISSVVFSLVHMPGGNATVVTFINIVLISILFSLLVFLTGSIFTACGFHFTWNYFQMVIFNTPNSTDRIKTALFKTSYISQDIYLNGGGFGPEGSLLSTVIFAVIIALILIVYGKKLRLNETL